MSKIEASAKASAWANSQTSGLGQKANHYTLWVARALITFVACVTVSALNAASKARNASPVTRHAQVSPSDGFLHSSIRVDRFPLYFEVSRLVTRMQERQSHPMWESEGESWILRATRYDPFSKKTNRIAYEFAQFNPEEVILTRVSVNETEYSGRDLIVVARAAFKDLIGAGLKKPAETREDCLARVAKSKFDTEAYVAELKRQGQYVAGWLDNGADNRFDRYGNIWETCDNDASPK